MGALNFGSPWHLLGRKPPRAVYHKVPAIYQQMQPLRNASTTRYGARNLKPGTLNPKP